MDNAQNSMLRKSYKINLKLNFSMLFGITLFFINETIRGTISDQFGWVNAPFFLLFILFFGLSLKKGAIHIPFFLLVLFFSVLTILNAFILDKNITYIVMTITNLLAPLFLLSIKITKEQALAALRIFVKMFNIIMITLTILGIYDFLTNSSLQLFFAGSIFHGTPMGDLIYRENSWGIYRYYSILGHPLQTAKYYLIFFITNNILARYQSSYLSSFVVSSITMVGLLLSSSKTALILGLFLILFLSGFKRMKFAYLAAIFVVMIIFINTPLFQDNLKVRFIEGYKTGDLTSGRQDLLTTLMKSEVEPPGLLLGGGADYSREVANKLNGRIYNFEYPVIMLAFDYGLIGVIIIYFCIAFFPIVKLIKSKQYYILALFAVLFIMINSNNGIANLGSDSLSQFCFLILIFINITKLE